MSTATSQSPVRPPRIAWSWQRALIGTVFALPAAIVALSDPASGMPLALGVLPATLLPLPPRRRGRIVLLIVGVITGASLFIGGAIAHLPLLATAALLIVAVVGAAVLASAVPAGRIVLVLCAPLVAAGLSYDDFASSTATFLLLCGGAAYAWLVSLAWPERDRSQRREAALPPRRAMVDYGVRMGLAGAIVYLIAAAFGLDHPGWAPAACLLVARPQLDLLESRGVGRVLSVALGAFAAVFFRHAAPPNWVFALAALVVLAAAAASLGSRWYITSAFTTFLVFVMLLNGHADETTMKVNERIGETVLGVAAAYLFGWAVPAIRDRLRTRAAHPRSPA